MDSNPVVGTTNHKPTVNSALHPSDFGKWVLRGSSEDTSVDAAGSYLLISCPYTQSALSYKSMLNTINTKKNNDGKSCCRVSRYFM